MRLRSSEAVLIVLAIAIGLGSGLLSILQGAVARTLQHWLFALPAATRLSEAPALPWHMLLALPIGGAAVALFTYLTGASRHPMVDAVEANALHGGRMSIRDSLSISGQTILSNGFGASVGLEAAYAQLGGALASVTGIALGQRRSDIRMLVGAGAGAAIAAAFGAPLAGAFYAFEIVIGAYTAASIAPVAAAALAAVFVTEQFGVQPYVIATSVAGSAASHHYLLFAVLGALCALVGIGLMLAVAAMETAAKRLPIPRGARPVVGGALLIPIAAFSPQVLSSGHGALHLDLAVGLPILAIAAIFAAKCAASIISLGFGFRGGLFFASLFLGTLLGHLYADLVNLVAGTQLLDPRSCALVGMAALAVAVVGGPMTLSMLVLEATHDFPLTGAVIAASLIASTIVREVFGYSFSTWRLHLRGETIRSARDVGWMRQLTADRLVRQGGPTAEPEVSVADFRKRFPLGATSRVALCDREGRYLGIVRTSDGHADGLDEAAPVSMLAVNKDESLPPDAPVLEIMRRFDATGADELAVVDRSGSLVGLVTEAFVRRRYAEELEKAQRDLLREK